MSFDWISIFADFSVGLYAPASQQLANSKVNSIGYFQAFGVYALNVLEKEDGKITASPLAPQQTASNSSSRVLLPLSYLLRFLSRLHSYLGCLYLFRYFSSSITNLEVS